MNPLWTDVEAAALLGAAFLLLRGQSTISKVAQRVYRKNPRLAAVGLAGLTVWFWRHLDRYPDEVL